MSRRKRAFQLGEVFGVKREVAFALGHTLGEGVGVVYEPEAETLFARMAAVGDEPNKARKGLINTRILGMKQSGAFAKRDAYYSLAAHGSPSSKLNWIQDAYNLTVVGTEPTFTVDAGTQGTGAGMLDSGFNPTTAPSPKFVRDNAHMFIWSLTNLNNGSGGTSNDAGAQGNSAIMRAGGTPGRATMRPNSSVANLGVNIAFPGHIGWVREGASLWQGYVNGADEGGGIDASAALSPITFRVNGNASTAYGFNQIATFAFGSALTPEEVAADYLAEIAWLQAIGALP